MLDAIVSLQPLQASEGGGSKEAMLLDKVHQLMTSLPEKVDLVELKFKLLKDDNPLNVVLCQELQRYNSLISIIARDLALLERGI